MENSIEDGPAVENIDGTREWFLNGRIHREDGPALEFADGTRCWYLTGKYFGDKKPENWEELILTQNFIKQTNRPSPLVELRD